MANLHFVTGYVEDVRRDKETYYFSQRLDIKVGVAVLKYPKAGYDLG